MFLWQNWAGIILALYLFKVAKNERLFIAAMIFFYAAYMVSNAYMYGIDAGYIELVSRERLIDIQIAVGSLNFLFIPILILSCLHISDNRSQQHKIRFYYIALTSLKAGMILHYASSLSSTSALFQIIALVEYFWFIPDFLVLLLGTTNPVSKKWTKIK